VTRPPRKPSRTRPLAALKPVGLVLVSLVLALLLLTAAIWFAATRSAVPAAGPWIVEVHNRGAVPIRSAMLFAVPESRGAHAVAEDSVGTIAPGVCAATAFVVYRPCVIRAELRIGGKVHVFERTVTIGPGHSSRVRIEVDGGPTVDGVLPDEVRDP